MSRTKSSWCLLAGLLSICATQPAFTEENYSRCVDSTSTNFDWSQCGTAEIARQETRLTTAWKKAFACFARTTDPTTADARQTFLASQRLWIKWKDAACSVYFPSSNSVGNAGFAGRQGEVLDAPAWTAQIIEQRSQWLDSFSKECH